MSGYLFDLMNPEPPTPREQGHRRAERAATHADTVTDGWTADAVAYITQFAHRQHRLDAWLLEDARTWAHAEGLAEPPDARAWGAVVKRLQATGVIDPVGTGTDSYGSLKSTWRVKS